MQALNLDVKIKTMLAIIIFLATCLIGGGANPTLIKMAVGELPPITVTWLRVSGAVLILLPFFLSSRERIPFKSLYKVLPFGLNLVLFSIGIQFTSVVMGNMLYSIDPIIVAFFGYIFLKEKLTMHSFIGLIVSLMGVAILISGSIKTSDLHSYGTPLGNSIVGLASLIWAFWFVTSRDLTKKYSNTTIIFYASLVTSLLLLPLLPFEWSAYALSLQSFFSPRTLSIILGVILITALLFQFLNQWLLKNTSAFFSSLTSYGSVFFAGLSGMIFFGENITIQLFLGGLFIITGVFLATTYKHIKNRRFQEV